MTASIERNVYVLRRELPNPIHYVRSTNAISLIFHFRDIEIPSGATAQIYVRKPSGKEVYNTAVISGSDVAVDVTTQMFIEAGKNILQVQINQGEENLITFEQPIIVHENYTEGDAEQSENESTLLQQYVDEVAQVAEDAKNEVQNEVANGKNDLDDYVEALKETIPADYTELSESIEQLERNKAPAIIEEASGTEITLDDSGSALVKDLQLYGYSKQIQTTGAQLYDANGNANSVSGVTLYIDDDGYVILNGTAKNDVFFNSSVESPFSGNVYVSMNNITVNGNVIFRFLNEGGAIINNFALDAVSKTASYNLMEAVHTMTIRIANGTTLNNFKMRPMINSGSSPLPWEPYSGGVASPSPDWPQPIHSVADEVNLAKTLITDVNTPLAAFPETTNNLYILLCPESGTSQVNLRLFYADGTTGQDASVVPADDQNGVEWSKQIKPTKPCVGVSIYNVTGSASRAMSYCMVAISDTPLPYHPYGHNVTVESAGANLLDSPKNITSSYGGISVKGLGDGSLLYSGTATDQNINVWIAGGWTNTDPFLMLRKGEYSGPHSEALFYRTTNYLNEDDVISVPNGGIGITGVRAPSAVVGTYYNKIIYPMLNRGSSPLPWQPYVAPSSALITLTDSLLGIPVDSGGNYTDDSGQQWIADYIYRRQTDGKWMLWRNCGEAVYDGSEDEGWRVSTSGNDIYVVSFNFGVPLVGGYMTSFVHQNGISSSNTYEVDSNKNLRVRVPEIKSVEDWETWLSANPQTVVYQLATPTIEELPEDVQTELNGLYTYNLHTDIWNSDNAYMVLKYVADTKSYINKKISEISEAIIERLN